MLKRSNSEVEETPNLSQLGLNARTLYRGLTHGSSFDTNPQEDDTLFENLAASIHRSTVLTKNRANSTDKIRILELNDFSGQDSSLHFAAQACFFSKMNRAQLKQAFKGMVERPEGSFMRNYISLFVQNIEDE